MISNIDIEKTLQNQPNAECLFVSVATILNTVIDAVNTIQKEREAERFEIQEWIGIVSDLRSRVPVVESRVSILEEHAHPTATTEPTENVQVDEIEQAEKWIGKLCWFSNGDGFDEVGYLTEIDPDMPEEKFRCDCHDYYKECKPVKPDDDIIYRGEQ